METRRSERKKDKREKKETKTPSVRRTVTPKNIGNYMYFPTSIRKMGINSKLGKLISFINQFALQYSKDTTTTRDIMLSLVDIVSKIASKEMVFHCEKLNPEEKNWYELKPFSYKERVSLNQGKLKTSSRIISDRDFKCIIGGIDGCSPHTTKQWIFKSNEQQEISC